MIELEARASIGGVVSAYCKRCLVDKDCGSNIEFYNLPRYHPFQLKYDITIKSQMFHFIQKVKIVKFSAYNPKTF